MLRNSVVSVFIRFRVRARHHGKLLFKLATKLHKGDGIPNLILLEEYANAGGKILE
jgi:hypothetical protein